MRDVKDIKDRLNSFKVIQPGWYQGHGEAIRPTAIHQAKCVLTQLNDLAHFYIYPSPDGWVQAEFTIGEYECELEFHGSSKPARETDFPEDEGGLIELFAWDFALDTDVGRTFDYGDINGVQDIRAFLEGLKMTQKERAFALVKQLTPDLEVLKALNDLLDANQNIGHGKHDGSIDEDTWNALKNFAMAVRNAEVAGRFAT